MTFQFSENISKLRKAEEMTQERLAEVLGVSFGAVSKWERGLAVPELGMIMRIAELFGVSVDALIGYELRMHDQDGVIQKLKGYLHDRSSQEALSDAEKALKRYPNCFEVVYYSAANYRVRGIYQKNQEYSQRAIALYEHALCLFRQNTDPEVSEFSISQAIAECYLQMEEYEKGLEILKRNNPGDIHHALIGYVLASSSNKPEEAKPYLSTALMDLTVFHMDIVLGFVNVYEKTGEYQNAIDILQWAISFLQGLRKGNIPNPLYKSEAELWLILAYMQLCLGQKKEALKSLGEAKKLALQFDAAPTYDFQNVRFVDDAKSAIYVDDMGETALEGLVNTIVQFACEEFMELWEGIRDEE